MASLSFPTLADEDIITFCKEVAGAEIPFTLAALQNPTMESTMMIFRHFVNDVFGWDLDAALVVPFDQMSRTQFFETHRDQVPVMRFYHVIRSLLKHVHYDAFSIEDLLQPRPRRLRRQLSALANFALQYQKTQDEYGDLVLERNREDILYHERLVKENRTLKSNIHKEIEREDELRSEIHREHELVEGRYQEISLLHDQKEQLDQETKQTRAEMARLEDRLSQSAVEDAKLNEGNAALEGQLVGSPDKVRLTLTRVQEELQSAEEQRQAASERRQDLRRVRQQAEQLSAGLERLLQRADVPRDLAERVREVNNRSKSVTDEMEAVRLETTELQGATRQQANRCEMIEESRESEMQKNKQYLKAKEEELRKREQVREEARSRLAVDQQEAAQLAARRQQMQTQALRDTEVYQQQLEMLQKKDAQLEQAVEWVRSESDRMQNDLLSKLDERLRLLE